MTTDSGFGNIRNRGIEEEMRSSYLDYAMSVIVARALPDVRDGLKPVQRRILYAMNEMGLRPNAAFRKSATVVGEVLGKYHPHGDSPVYEAMARLAQDFSMRYPLVHGQGNFGSIDGDPPAAMRYTEAKMAAIAEELLADIDANTVDTMPTYDDSRQEPIYLPARIPNLLLNGADGIAVGMATKIPPHTINEIADAVIALIENAETTTEELTDIVHGPDFPTGGIIYRKRKDTQLDDEGKRHDVMRDAIREAYADGRGRIVMQARASIEEMARGNREQIVVTELPYQVNKAALVEKIAELVREKRIEGISDLRDESDRQGMRIVIEMKRDAPADVILNQLYRFTPLQTSFGVNMLALNRGRPQQMGLRDMVTAFVDFREEVVVRRTKFELSKSRDRGHVLVGLAIAVANIDVFIHIIRSSKDPAEARERLIAKDWPAGDMLPLVDLIQDPRTLVIDKNLIRLSDEQARAILALTLSRLTGLGREEIFGEATELATAIQGYLDILASRERVMAIVREELVEVRAAYAVPRRTQIVDGDADVEDEDLIAREDMVITVTHGGYVKRTPLSIYRTQHRGGKGRSGMATKDEDAVTRVFSANTHTPMLFFSSGGKAYKLKVWRLPVGTPTSRGKAFVNLLPIEPGESITSILPLPEDEASWDQYDVMFATRSGGVRRNKLSDFIDIRRNGKIAMKLDEGDAIIGVGVCNAGVNDILLTTALGRCIRFATEEVRVFAGRDSTGVRGIRLAAGDSVISMAILRSVEATPAERAAYVKQANAIRRAANGEGEEPEDIAAPDDEEEVGDEALPLERFAALGAAEEVILTVSTEGFGKRTSAYEFRRTGRGGQGLLAQDLTKKGGKLAASFPVEEFDEILLVTDQGQLIRTPVSQVRMVGRNTSGVTIFRTAKDEHVVSVERLADTGEEDEDEAEVADDAEAGPESDDGPDAGNET
jgi:DNA gyrase subunit A